MDDTLDAAFWLPTQILNDNDAPAMELNSKTKKSGGYGFDIDAPKALFPFEFPYGSAFGVSSDFSSPVESSETESDEEDYLVGLTSQMARSTLDDEFKYSDSVFAFEKPKGWVASGFPQSTLYAVGSGCGQVSSRGSPNAQSPLVTWDLLHAAAEEVAKMHINQSRGLLGHPRKPSPIRTLQEASASAVTQLTTAGAARTGATTAKGSPIAALGSAWTPWGAKGA
ncbi:hypothetical protein FF1_017453 [Malus domestica]